MDERVPGVADREEHERRAEGQLAANPVDRDPRDGSGDEADGSGRPEHEAGEAERDPTDVVQVDEGERQDDAVAERVGEPTELQRLDGAR